MRKHTERFFAMSPIVYMTEVGIFLAKIGSHLRSLIYAFTNFIHFYDLLGSKCGNSQGKTHQGSDAINMKVIDHYAQFIAGDNGPIFRKFDYTWKNQEIYGQSKPPEWSFNDYNTPTHLIVGGRDDLATAGNVAILKSRLPAGIWTENVFPNWTHPDPLNPPDDPKPLFDIIASHLGLDE